MSTRSFHTARGARAGAVASIALALAACADPTGNDPVAARLPVAAQAPAHGQAPASVEWNGVARGLVARNRSNVFVAFRVYALVSVAQKEALEAAEAARAPGSVPSRRAAIAGASAVALRYLYPADGPMVDALVQQQLASRDWLERDGVDVAAGEAAGRAAAAAVVERARTDGYSDPWTGTVPTGPDKWYSITTPPTPPAGATLVDARTWFLTSPGQFRPEPHPAFGSPEFLAALAEVRHISDTRTREQDSIAKFWAMGAGTSTPPGYWNDVASTLALRYSLNEARATHLLALLNMTAWDAIIASNDAKYTYWLLRPSQADPAITLSIAPLPNFPAYPSNHATISSAMAEIIADAFPSHAREMRAAAEQAALSRVYGGIHYRFDGDAGLALGRQVAEWAIAQDKE
jgi:membrane-associated phospholipid phosphatase